MIEELEAKIQGLKDDLATITAKRPHGTDVEATRKITECCCGIIENRLLSLMLLNRKSLDYDEDFAELVFAYRNGHQMYRDLIEALIVCDNKRVVQIAGWFDFFGEEFLEEFLEPELVERIRKIQKSTAKV